jgi:predicted PurR-regulated permease PerM
MQARYWWKITLIILTITILLGLSGCQVIEGMENTADEFSQIPDRLEQAVFNLLAGIRNIGGALADQIRNIIGNMTGR